MKKTLLSLVSALLLSGCTTTNISQEKDLERKLVYSSSVINNPKNKVRYYSFRSENEGIKDLRNFLKSAKKEEAYIFIPSQNLWVEVGFNEQKSNIKRGRVGSLVMNEEVIKKYGSINNHVSIWHTHLYRESKDNVIPSSTDLSSFFYVYDLISKNNKNFLCLKDGVISIYGESYFILKNTNSSYFMKKEEEGSFSDILLYLRSSLVYEDVLKTHNLLMKQNPNLDKKFNKDVLKGDVTIYFEPKK